MVRRAFYNRIWGDCGLMGGEEAVANRRRVAEDMGVDVSHLLIPTQTHSPHVITLVLPWTDADRPQADALVTCSPHLALGILTADCVPVLFADVAAGVIGAAHAGWRGALGGVLENTVMAMCALGARVSMIKAWLGPCIHADSYEVSAEFSEPFLAHDPSSASFFLPAEKRGHCMFDLPGYVLDRLQKKGVVDVGVSPADTCANPELFFSHRAGTLQGKACAGRMLSVIALKPEAMPCAD